MSSSSEAFAQPAPAQDEAHRWQEECQRVEADFFRHFSRLGYRRHPEEPLLPRADPTLLFTNSFIVGLKPLIRSGLLQPDERLVIRQACLRTQNLARHPLDCSPLAYSSRFEMIGGLVGPQHLLELLVELHALFAHRYGVGDRLRMKASQHTAFFLEHLDRTPWAACTELETEPARYYSWTYGEPELIGRGVTFALVSSSTGATGDFGNIVELVYRGRVIGYEFGFGVETFVCRKFSLLNPVVVSPLTELMPEWAGPRFDSAKDLTRVAHTLFGLGIRAGKGGARHVLRKACRSLAQQIDAEIITQADLQKVLERLGGINVGEFMAMFIHQHLLLHQQREATIP